MKSVLVWSWVYSSGHRSTERVNDLISHRAKRKSQSWKSWDPNPGQLAQQLLLCEEWVNNEAFSLSLSVPSFRPRISQFVAFHPKLFLRPPWCYVGNTASTLLLTVVFQNRHRMLHKAILPAMETQTTSNSCYHKQQTGSIPVFTLWTSARVSRLSNQERNIRGVR